MSGHGESKTDVHAGGVVLYRRVNKLFEFGERDNFIEFTDDLALAHAKNRTRQKGIFSAGKLGMEAGADFEETADTAVYFRPTSRGSGDARENFKERRLPCAVSADKAEDFTLADVEGNIFQGPKSFVSCAAKYRQR